MVEAEDEEAGKPSTIPRCVSGAGAEAAARLWELTARSESRVPASGPQFPFCSVGGGAVHLSRGHRDGDCRQYVNNQHRTRRSPPGAEWHMR